MKNTTHRWQRKTCLLFMLATLGGSGLASLQAAPGTGNGIHKMVAWPVTGKVVNAAGDPLPGVTVLLKGSTNGTATGPDGSFTLQVPEAPGVLVVSFIGFVNQEIPFKGPGNINITLKDDAKTLEEVVVVGYGTVAKRELTSAVTTVTAKDLLSGAFNSPMQMVDGKVPGLTVSFPAAADPNAGANLQIRGASSLGAGNGPLVIIDGMPGGDLRNISQQDIESISVLRDGSAAAIYGSRGANGVILVQTKRGRAGKVSVTYDSFIEQDRVSAKPEVLSAEEFLAKGRGQDFGARTNWFDELIREDNFGQNHFLSVGGGSENTAFRISGNYKTKSGIDIASDRKEYGIRANFNQKALEGLFEFGGNFSYRVANEEYTNYGAFNQALRLNPTQPIMSTTNPNLYNRLTGFDFNPIQDLQTRENGADRTYSIIDMNAKLNILKNLNTELKLARQGSDRFGRQYYNSKSAESIENNRVGRAALSQENWTDWTLEWTGNYHVNLDKHDLKVLGGYSYQQFDNRSFNAENMNFPSDAFGYNNLGAGLWQTEAGRLGMGSNKSREKTIAFLSRVNYSFHDTYFLTGIVRYEGNTKFGNNNKWGLFPALSAAWRLSSLPVFQRPGIDDLKLRVSYGETGRSGFGRYTSLSRYSSYGQYLDESGQWIRGYGPGNNQNANLKWERQKSYNLGLDFAFFENKLSGSVDGFLRQSKDLLADYDVPLPPYLHTQMFVNVGTTSAKGVELILNWNAVQGKDFRYTTNVTSSYTKSRLDKFSNGDFARGFIELGGLPSPGNPGNAFRLQDGIELGSFYGYKYAGVDEQGKMLIWKEAKEGGDKILSTQSNPNRDKTYLGNGMPRYELTWGNTLGYKQFDLSLYFRGRFDYQILNMYQMYYGLVAESGTNLLQDAYDRNGHITSGKVISDYFLENGDFFRLDNLTLGWTPQVAIKHLSSLRLYGTVRNVFVLTKYSGLDPNTVNVTGLTPGLGGLDVYPITRNFALGAQINF